MTVRPDSMPGEASRDQRSSSRSSLLSERCPTTPKDTLHRWTGVQVDRRLEAGGCSSLPKGIGLIGKRGLGKFKSKVALKNNETLVDSLEEEAGSCLAGRSETGCPLVNRKHQGKRRLRRALQRTDQAPETCLSNHLLESLDLVVAVAYSWCLSHRASPFHSRP